MLDGRARPEPSLWLLTRSSVLSRLPNRLGLWAGALFRSGALDSSDSLRVRDAKMPRRPGSG